MCTCSAMVQFFLSVFIPRSVDSQLTPTDMEIPLCILHHHCYLSSTSPPLYLQPLWGKHTTKNGRKIQIRLISEKKITIKIWCISVVTKTLRKSTWKGLFFTPSWPPSSLSSRGFLYMNCEGTTRSVPLFYGENRKANWSLLSRSRSETVWHQGPGGTQQRHSTLRTLVFI